MPKPAKPPPTPQHPPEVGAPVQQRHLNLVQRILECVDTRRENCGANEMAQLVADFEEAILVARLRVVCDGCGAPSSASKLPGSKPLIEMVGIVCCQDCFSTATFEKLVDGAVNRRTNA